MGVFCIQMELNTFTKKEGGEKMTTQQKVQMLMIQGGDSGDRGYQKELAEILGISITSVANKLKGRQEWKVGEIRIFAKRYNLSAKAICETFIWRE